MARKGIEMPTAKSTIHLDLIKVAGLIAEEGLDKTEKGHHFNYRGIDGLLSLMSKVLKQAGVVIIPVVRDWETIDQPGKNGKAWQTRVVVDYTLCNGAGDSVVATAAGEAMGSDDKGIGKAMSYAYKNCMFQLFAIPLKGQVEDTDADQEYNDDNPMVPNELAAPPKALMDSCLAVVANGKRTPEEAATYIQNQGYRMGPEVMSALRLAMPDAEAEGAAA